MKDRPTGSERAVFKEAVSTLENDIAYNTVFHLQEVTTLKPVATQIFEAVTLSGDSISIIGSSGNGKSTIKKEVLSGKSAIEHKMGLPNRKGVSLSWGGARAQAQKHEEYGPISNWELLDTFSYPDRLLQQQILDNLDVQQFNDFNGLGIGEFNRGIGTLRLTARLDRIARGLEPPSRFEGHRAYMTGKKMKFLAVVPNFALQEYTDLLRDGVKAVPEGESVVEALKDGLKVEMVGSVDTPQYNDALRNWAETSAKPTAMHENRAEFQEQATHWLENLSHPEMEKIDQIQIPLMKFVRFLRFTQPSFYHYEKSSEEVIIRAYKDSVAYMQYFLREDMGVPNQDLTLVHNIPIIHKDGTLKIPSPV